MNKSQNIIFIGLRILTAFILLQTLYFKFSAHPESTALFTKLGMEPWGRIGVGVAELIVGLLLLFPRTAFLGGLGAVGLMAGAIFFHITILGINMLFFMALTAFIGGAIVSWIAFKRGTYPTILKPVLG